MSPKLNDGKRKTDNLNMQRIYFPEISGTQRKSIIEVRQVLSKVRALRRVLSHFGRRALGESASLAPRQGAAAVSLRRLARGEEACARGIYIYAKKTIKFSHIGKDCANFRATNARHGVIYITAASIIDAPLEGGGASSRRKPSRNFCSPAGAKAGRVTNDNNDTDKESTWVHMAVSVFIHGGDSALSYKKRTRRRNDPHLVSCTTCVCAVCVYVSLIISSAPQWPPCGRLFRGRLNEAD